MFIMFFCILILDSRKIKLNICLKISYFILFLINSITAINILIKQNIKSNVKIYWIVLTLIIIIIFRFTYFIINLVNYDKDIIKLVPFRVLIYVFIEYFILVLVEVYWIINCFGLFFIPNKFLFKNVIILTTIMPSWVFWRIYTIDNKKNFAIFNVFLPLCSTMYIFIFALLSLVRSFLLFYKSYELLIFLSISYFLTIQTILGENYLDLMGFNRIIKLCLNKSFLRMFMLFITNITAFTNNNLDFVRSINSGILFSIAFDSFFKNIEKKKKNKFSDEFIDKFVSEHEIALDKHSDVEYLRHMSKKYGKIRLIDINDINECISNFYFEEFEDYLPKFITFYTYITIEDLYLNIIRVHSM